MKHIDLTKDFSSIEEALQRLHYLEQQKDNVLKYVESYMIETLSIDDHSQRTTRETELRLFFDEMRKKKMRLGINYDV